MPVGCRKTGEGCYANRPERTKQNIELLKANMLLLESRIELEKQLYYVQEKGAQSVLENFLL